MAEQTPSDLSTPSEGDADAAPFYIRSLETSDRNWVAHFLDKHWGSTKIVSRGEVYYAHLLPGFVAIVGSPEADPPGEVLGLLTYRIQDDEIEIITIDSVQPKQGVGSALVESLRAAAAAEAIKRLWLVVTNDNLNALKFYQKRGFRLVAVYPNALSEARKLKPQIPLIGRDDIPLHDEIELALKL